MDKITKFSIILLFLSSCSLKRESFNNCYNLIFKYGDVYPEINFNKGTILINYSYFKYIDSIKFSDKEKQTIINSFNQYLIYGIKKDVFYGNDSTVNTPLVDFKIQLFKNQKLQSETSIDFDYQMTSTSKISDKKYRVVKFRDDVVIILESNKNFKKAIDSLRKYEIENKIIRM